MKKNIGNVIIRKLTVEDVEDYRVLRLRALEEHPESFGSSVEEEKKKSLDDIIKRFETTYNRTNNFIVGAVAENVLIGMAGFFQMEPIKVRHKGYLWGMYVVKDAMGSGIGKLLLQSILKQAKQIEGIEQIQLSVVADNERAKQLYERFGFQVYGIERKALRVNDIYVDEEHRVLFLS